MTARLKPLWVWSVGIMAKMNDEIRAAEKEIMDILSEHIAPDWSRVGELMRVANW